MSSSSENSYEYCSSGLGGSTLPKSSSVPETPSRPVLGLGIHGQPFSRAQRSTSAWPLWRAYVANEGTHG